MKKLFKRNKEKKAPSFAKTRKKEEQRLLDALSEKAPGSKEYSDILRQLTELGNVHKDSRPSAENIISAATSIGGLGMAIGYDQTHNLSRHAASFIRRPRG